MCKHINSANKKSLQQNQKPVTKSCSSRTKLRVAELGRLNQANASTLDVGGDEYLSWRPAASCHLLRFPPLHDATNKQAKPPDLFSPCATVEPQIFLLLVFFN